jgi:hypothetical protein
MQVVASLRVIAGRSGVGHEARQGRSEQRAQYQASSCHGPLEFSHTATLGENAELPWSCPQGMVRKMGAHSDPHQSLFEGCL